MMAEHGTYWSFWLAGAALGAITVVFWLVLRLPLGVSGQLARLTNLRRELEAERASARELSDDELAEALLEATRAAAAGESCLGRAAEPAPPAADVDPGAGPRGRTLAPPPALAATVAFLAALSAGGAIAAFLRGAWLVTAAPGGAFERIVGAGAHVPAVLVAGGFLVGLGTSLCGGCSSGHGLTGCARLERGSLLAAACFVAAGVATSLLLAWRAA